MTNWSFAALFVVVLVAIALTVSAWWPDKGEQADEPYHENGKPEDWRWPEQRVRQREHR